MMQLPQDPDVVGTDRKPALTIASGQGHVEVARLLLEAWADSNSSDGSGWTALMIASGPGHVEIALAAGGRCLQKLGRRLWPHSFDESIRASSCRSRAFAAGGRC